MAFMEEDATPDDWYDDVPSADPAIRKEYEAALGRFILAYNEVDYRLSKVIAIELSDRGNSDWARQPQRAASQNGLRSLRSL
jgi:hypothetical protein